VTAGLAVLGAVAFALREVDVLRRRSEPQLALLTRLGVPAGAGGARLWTLAALPVVLAVLLGACLGALALDRGVLAPVLPHALRVAVVLTVVAALGVTLVFLALGVWRASRRVECG
jgi:hypothetical protein